MTLSNSKNIKKLTSERGFTIVELLIVIIVIGILATLVLIAYNNVQGQARDTKRQADASTIRDASATYKLQSTNNAYPDVTSGANFQTSLNSLSPKSVTVDTTLTANLNVKGYANTQSVPNASNKDYIYAVYCNGAATTTDAGAATGLKIQYWSETAPSATALKTVTTGTCS